MAKQGKRFSVAEDKYDITKLYDYAEAAKIVKQTATAKFDETIEVAVKLGVDVKHADQQVRGTTTLPHGTGKKVKVLVFAAGEKLSEAEAAGADFAGGEDLVEKVKGGWFDFDIAVATPDMMSKVGKLGKLLGPRGLMPNPKSGTVTFNVSEAVKEFKAGKIEYRTDKFGVVHGIIGHKTFEEKMLEENLAAFMQTLLKAKPAAAKGQYIRSITISSTMGPGIKVQLATA